MDLDVSEMDADDEQLQKTTPVLVMAQRSGDITAAPANRIRENIFQSIVPMGMSTVNDNGDSDGVKSEVHNNIIDNGINNALLNDKVTSISTAEYPDGVQTVSVGRSENSGSGSSINNNDTKPVILVNDNGNGDGNDDGISEKGYYEKTIVNKNGVYIENIRKITNIDQRILSTSNENDNDNDNVHKLNTNTENSNTAEVSGTASDGNANAAKMPSNSFTGKFNRKSIELMNAPVARAQHYMITSSGKIEKTDALVSDDVNEQFQGGLNYNNNINNSSDSDYHNNYVLNSRKYGQIDGADELVARQQQQRQNQTNAAIAASTEETFSEGAIRKADTIYAMNSAAPSVLTSSTYSTASSNSNKYCYVMGKYLKFIDLCNFNAKSIEHSETSSKLFPQLLPFTDSRTHRLP